jgi:phage-related minor tail protein
MGLAAANGEVTQAALLQARYALILEQSTNAQGDFARTSGGMANQSRIMTAQLKDAAAMLGQNLLPLVLSVVQGLNKLLTSFNGMSPTMQKAVIGFAVFLAALGPILSVVGSVITLISGLASIAGTLGISFAGVASAASAAGAAVMAVGASIAAVALPILLIIGTLALLYLAFKNNWFGITDTVKQAWFLLGYYINQIVVKIKSMFQGINLVAAGKNMMIGLANGIVSGVSYVVKAAIAAAKAALAAIKNTLGIHSPSAEFMKLGAFSGQGFQMGLQNAMNPNEIARTMAKPVQNMSSNTSTNNTINLSGGLTLRDVDEMMSRKINSFAGRLDKALGA